MILLKNRSIGDLPRHVPSPHPEMSNGAARSLIGEDVPRQVPATALGYRDACRHSHAHPANVPSPNQASLPQSQTRLRPDCLALYNALSAHLNNSSGLVAVTRAIPILIVILITALLVIIWVRSTA